MTIKAEVEWGEANEVGILARWMRAKRINPDKFRAIKSRPFQDWDFLVLDADGRIFAYVEIKCRRRSFADYGDLMSPMRKHAFARTLLSAHKVEFLLVTEYTDALVECHLADPPASERMVGRRDRPHSPRVPHGLWTGGQLTVLERWEPS